jgi:hypothetical protein
MAIRKLCHETILPIAVSPSPHALQRQGVRAISRPSSQLATVVRDSAHPKPWVRCAIRHVSLWFSWPDSAFISVAARASSMSHPSQMASTPAPQRSLICPSPLRCDN